jgi:hypothetical protein
MDILSIPNECVTDILNLIDIDELLLLVRVSKIMRSHVLDTIAKIYRETFAYNLPKQLYGTYVRDATNLVTNDSKFRIPELVVIGGSLCYFCKHKSRSTFVESMDLTVNYDRPLPCMSCRNTHVCNDCCAIRETLMPRDACCDSMFGYASCCSKMVCPDECTWICSDCPENKYENLVALEFKSISGVVKRIVCALCAKKYDSCEEVSLLEHFGMSEEEWRDRYD